jgi:hypothetical protein
MILEQIYTDIPEEQRHIASLSSTQAAENCLTKGHGFSGGALRENREGFISELEVAKLASKSGLVCALTPNKGHLCFATKCRVSL